MRIIHLPLFSFAMLLGVFSGALLVDGTFINFRGDQIRRAIEELGADLPDPSGA